MGIIWAALVGLVAGALAKLLMPGKDPGGIFITMLLGVIGAMVATFIGRAVGWYDSGEGAGLLGAVAGSIIILVLYRMIRGRGSAAAT